MESYKQIKADLDVLRQSVEKSELWVYKPRSDDEHSKINHKEDEEDNVKIRITPKLIHKIGTIGKQDSVIDLDIGPIISPRQSEEYKKIQQVS